MAVERQASNLPREVVISGYEGKIINFEGIKIHPEKTWWTFGAGNYQIPVYSIWNYELHQEIAEQIASGKSAAIYMWGTYGVGKLLRSPEWHSEEKEESNDLRTKLKKDRPWSEQFANIIYPDDLIDILDTDRLHPTLKNLQWPQNRWKLFGAGPVHIIAPVKSTNPHLDKSLVRNSDRTASCFYMPHPGLDHLVRQLRKIVKNATFGGGSFNYHGETPAFTTPTLFEMISQKSLWQENLGLVIVCEISEASEIDRGQLQIRLAQKNSDGKSHIVRDGALMAETWSEYTGIPVKDAPEGVKQASSRKPYRLDTNLIIDWKVAKSRDVMERYHQQAA